jgi:hypothetical protein
MEPGGAARATHVPAVVVSVVRARRAEAPAFVATAGVRAVGRTSTPLSGRRD